MPRNTAIDKKWQEPAAAKAEAEKLPHGRQRDALAREARQLDTASKMKEWLSSAGLEAPK
jgi:hypothetical protein